MSTLLPQHQQQLQDSAIAPGVAAARGYTSATTKAALKRLGFSYAQQLPPALVIPIHTTAGRVAFHQIRPDQPRRGADGDTVKYETPPKAHLTLDVPPVARPGLLDPKLPLFVTEGSKKVDSAVSKGLCCVALVGVWGFLATNPFGGKTALIDWRDVALNDDRQVYLCFDSDVTVKSSVAQALRELKRYLGHKGAKVAVVYLRAGPGGTKTGLDDFFAAGGTVDKLLALAEDDVRPDPPADSAPGAGARPPDEVIDVLDEAPASISRPLSLVDGTAYLVGQCAVRTTIHARVDDDGERRVYDPPLIKVRSEPFVVRGDGRVFAYAGTLPMAPAGDTAGAAVPTGGGGLLADATVGDLPALLTVPEVPPGRLVRPAAVARYRVGVRASPGETFRRVRAAYAHFVDFTGAYTDADVLLDLWACYSLMTYFAAAFPVLPSPYLLGTDGTGKSQTLQVWARTSALGQLITEATSPAALRTMASLGAALAVDEAETLSDPKKNDPDKRALLLASSRKGVTVPLMEPMGKDRGWKVVYVDAFCPRAYASIAAPDATLASRCAIQPMVRTASAATGTSNPAADEEWPCDPLALQDELWLLGLRLLPEARQSWATFRGGDVLTGRVFEPWRAPLAVARLLDAQPDVPEDWTPLEPRIRKAMEAYQTNRAELVGTDPKSWAVRALWALAFPAGPEPEAFAAAGWAAPAADGTTPRPEDTVSFAATDLFKATKAAMTDAGAAGANEFSATQAGIVLKAWGIHRDREKDAGRARVYRPRLDLIVRTSRAYGLLPPEPAPPPTNPMIHRVSPEPPPAPPVEAVSPAAPETGHSGHSGHVPMGEGQRVQQGVQPDAYAHRNGTTDGLNGAAPDTSVDTLKVSTPQGVQSVQRVQELVEGVEPEAGGDGAPAQDEEAEEWVF